MHVVLVSHYSPPHPGGVQFVVGQLWDRLAIRGYRTTMISCDTGIPSGAHDDGTKTRIGLPAINFLEKYSIPFPIFDPIALKRALSDVLKTADVVHAHGMLFMSSVFAASMARRRRIPVILTEHVGKVPYRNVFLDGAQRLAFETLGRSCCRKSDAITVLNRRVEREVRSLIGTKTPVTRVPNGVDTSFFRPPTPEEREAFRRKWGFGRFVALFVGRSAKKKGLSLLREARSADFDLVLCGAPEERSDDHVRSLGVLDQATLASLYRAADVLVLPSEGEGFPLVVQEAMASGLPVVVTDNLENREYLDDTVARFTLREPQAIREAIESVIRSPEKRQTMGAAARDWALAHFDWERSLDRYVELYHRHRNGNGL